MEPRPDGWDHLKIGAGEPPIQINRDWLAIDHAVDQDKVYRLSVVLLGLGNPTKTVHRPAASILDPEEPGKREEDVPAVSTG
jgi:beta-1,4-mannooligosaccharide/beta-1,4-mannosyl-N-acetylglucosamine phosphorylase